MHCAVNYPKYNLQPQRCLPSLIRRFHSNLFANAYNDPTSHLTQQLKNAANPLEFDVNNHHYNRQTTKFAAKEPF